MAAVFCSSPAAAAPENSDPATVARQYVDGVNSGTLPPDLLCAELENTPDEPSSDDPEEEPTKPGDVKATLGEVEIEGDQATFEVTVTESGESTTTELRLVKEGDAWKVCGPAE
ncbi:hypothetical protein ACFVMC_28795 [Nocardia sp. NPDC127579]|uniref:Rv0361 family membrane protein n=1 Tax=Nocardia sp. NPDC127579 TaxID=3345402 RepID=UPI0036414C3C